MMSAITMQRKQKTRSTATYLDASRLNAVATKKHPPRTNVRRPKANGPSSMKHRREKRADLAEEAVLLLRWLLAAARSFRLRGLGVLRGCRRGQNHRIEVDRLALQPQVSHVLGEINRIRGAIDEGSVHHHVGLGWRRVGLRRFWLGRRRRGSRNLRRRRCGTSAALARGRRAADAPAVEDNRLIGLDLVRRIAHAF